ncbi:MAG: hypothetical protein LUQ50_09420 [Methanospirillum sp.]|uniref:hypothetical protein n=1 Tax=Methanospirillum sp. TaxID=45200 RepID=UPI002373B3FD|nr:hypothetical protein [Methanospirillum sp.]MDD1729278.1 hypothetical protein [Methanospirillum sp.]
MKRKSGILDVTIAPVLLADFTAADVLPNVTPDNQVFTINTVIDGTGAVDEFVPLAMMYPVELNYQIAVTHNANSGRGFAEGTIKTVFAGIIMETLDGNNDNYALEGT